MTRYEIPIRWGDMDAYGHVNNVQFLRLLEEARVYAFKDWFGHERDLIDDGILVARQEIDYLAPLTFRYAPALIDVWCSRVSGASFDIGYAVRQAGDEPPTDYALAEVTLVAYDLRAQAPRRLSGDERAALDAVAGDPVRLRSHTRSRQ